MRAHWLFIRSKSFLFSSPRDMFMLVFLANLALFVFCFVRLFFIKSAASSYTKRSFIFSMLLWFVKSCMRMTIFGVFGSFFGVFVYAAFVIPMLCVIFVFALHSRQKNEE